MKHLAIFIAAILTFFSCSAPLTVDNSVSGDLKLDKYLGEWYEIARFDHKFERGISHSKAEYTLNENGTVKVVNSGIKNGKPKESKGKAKLTDDPRILRVSFFGPFYGDYRILWIDIFYNTAIVGGGSDDFLWILSRHPQIDPITRGLILDEATKRGYDIDKLIWVEQE